jgi:hypothetical protein
MPIPDFNDEGLLPPGVYDCTLEEIVNLLGQDQWVDDRLRPCRSLHGEKLREYVEKLRGMAWKSQLILDGSFVTNDPEPHDIDLILVLAADHDFSRDPLPAEYNVLSRKRVRSLYKFDIFVVREDSPEYRSWEAFFFQVRNRPDLSKGLLRLWP